MKLRYYLLILLSSLFLFTLGAIAQPAPERNLKASWLGDRRVQLAWVQPERSDLYTTCVFKISDTLGTTLLGCDSFEPGTVVVIVPFGKSVDINFRPNVGDRISVVGYTPLTAESENGGLTLIATEVLTEPQWYLPLIQVR